MDTRQVFSVKQSPVQWLYNMQRFTDSQLADASIVTCMYYNKKLSWRTTIQVAGSNDHGFSRSRRHVTVTDGIE